MVTYVKSGAPPAVSIFGVPFDSSSTYRTGSRFGPNAIREAFLNIEIYSHRLKVDLESQSIEDLGNLYHTANIDRMASAVEKVVGELVDEGKIPAILGGEHTLTYGSFLAMPKDACIVYFDAHFDMRNEYSELSLMHATCLRRIIEKRGRDKVIHVGARAACAEEWSFVEKETISAITCEKIFRSPHPEELLKEAVKDFQNVYVSIDLDVIDPAYAPGVGNPEPGGLSTHQMLEMIYALKDKHIAGFDIVELIPHYDNGAASTAAARLLAELACLVVLEKGR
ncbi:MAG: agmatinase [Thaumarchaeota archaeon]|nr:agmatinase [Nitrososphaerota archaeon]